jgi:phosphoglycolate phosphatase
VTSPAPRAEGVRGVLFDLDGTLVDSLPLITAAVVETLGRHGFHFEPSTVGRVVGPPMPVMLQQLTGVTPPEAHALYEEYLVCYLERHAPRTQPLEGAAELLDALTAARVPFALVTNKESRGAEALLAAVGWQDRFAAVVGTDAATRVKPDPAHAFEAAARLGLTPAEVAYLGDLDVDMQCATGAGVPLRIGYVYEETPEVLRAAGATHIVTHLSQVAPLLGVAPVASR